jgi:hypothetical protein
MATEPINGDEKSEKALTTLVESVVGPVPWIERATSLSSAVLVVAGGAMQFGMSLTAPQVRWTIAAIVGVLCASAVLMPVIAKSATRPRGPISALIYGGVVVSTLIIIIDICLMVTQHRQPLDCIGYRVRDAKNPELNRIHKHSGVPRWAYFDRKADISLEAHSHDLDAESLYRQWPSFIDLKLQKRSHVDRVVIDDIHAEIVSYWPIGLVAMDAAPAPTSGTHPSEDIEIPIVIIPLRDQRPEQLPWRRPADQVVTHPDVARVVPWWQFERQLNKENDYARFNIAFLAQSPGLYDVNIVVTANGQPIVASPTPVRVFCHTTISTVEFLKLRQAVLARRNN